MKTILFSLLPLITNRTYSVLAISSQVVKLYISRKSVDILFPFPYGVYLMSNRIDFLNLERYPETVEAYADQHNPEFLVDISKRMNAQADRLEFLFMDIVTSPDHQAIEYKDILHWRNRAEYLRNTGKGRAAKRLEKQMALEEAKSFDNDEEFQAGYKEFLASEFDLS